LFAHACLPDEGRVWRRREAHATFFWGVRIPAEGPERELDWFEDGDPQFE
jgi:hypothetical protein